MVKIKADDSTYSRPVRESAARITNDLDSLVGDHVSEKELRQIHEYLLWRLGELEGLLFPDSPRSRAVA